MSKKYGTLLGDFLELVGEAVGFEWPPEYSEGWRLKQIYGHRQRYYKFAHQAKEKGYITKVRKNGKVFLELTSKGQLQILINKMGVEKTGDWDGKWRLVVFDIPEEHSHKRDILRFLLKKKGFIKLQASVFVSPYPLNREAIEYLKQSGLMKFIRIGKIEQFEDDTDLRKRFGLK